MGSSEFDALKSPDEKSKEEKSSGEQHHEDAMTQIIGEFGPWQLMWTSMLCVPIALHGWQMMANKFLTFKTDHWCARPELYQETSVDAWLNMTAPLLPDGTFDRCNIYDLDYSSGEIWNRPENTTQTIKCEAWEYDHSIFKYTAIERYDLVCDKKQVPRIIQMLFFIGNFVGVMFCGVLSDKFGRKYTYLGFMTFWIVFGVIGGVINNLWAWAFCRFMCGACSLAYNTILAVYCVEITHGKWRAISGHIFGELVWNIGIITLGGLVYGVRNMRTLEVIIGLSCTPWMVMWYFMFESPRWLLANGKTEQAKGVLKQACKINKKSPEPIDDFINNFVQADKVEKGSIADLFKTPAIRRNTLALGFCWMAFSMGYFGLLYNTPSLGWNMFLVFVFPAIIVSVISVIQPFMENRFGRKPLLSASLLVAGTMLLVTLFLPSGSGGIVVCAWIGTSACSVAFGVGYNFTKELYPTVLRTTALSVCSATARIGSILSPVIAMLGTASEILPLLVYGLIVFTAGILSLWIWPETKSIRLPDTIEECEKIAATRNPWVTCKCCSNSTSEVQTEDDLVALKKEDLPALAEKSQLYYRNISSLKEWNSLKYTDV